MAAHLRRAKHPASAFLGFDVSRPNALLAPNHADEKFTVLTAALNTAFFASKVRPWHEWGARGWGVGACVACGQ